MDVHQIENYAVLIKLANHTMSEAIWIGSVNADAEDVLTTASPKPKLGWEGGNPYWKLVEPESTLSLLGF